MNYCKKCQKKYSNNKVFCGDCGNKLTDFVESSAKDKTHVKQPADELKSSIKETIQEHKKNKPNVLKVLVLLFALILIFMPTYVSYQVSEPTQVQYPISYRVATAYHEQDLSGLNWVTNGFITIENTDTVPGTFEVKCNFRGISRTLTDTNRAYIVPTERETVKCSVDTDFSEDTEFTYAINPGTKTITEVRTVTKQRAVRVYQKILGLY